MSWRTMPVYHGTQSTIRNDVLTQRMFDVSRSMPRAPGRVNLISEHTDDYDGFVLPMAIDYDIRIAERLRSDRTVRLYSAG